MCLNSESLLFLVYMSQAWMQVMKECKSSSILSRSNTISRVTLWKKRNSIPYLYLFQKQKMCLKAHLECIFYGRSTTMSAKWSPIPTHCSCFVSQAVLSKDDSTSLFPMTVYPCNLWSNLTHLHLKLFLENKVKFHIHMNAHTFSSTSRGLLLTLVQNSDEFS